MALRLHWSLEVKARNNQLSKYTLFWFQGYSIFGYHSNHFASVCLSTSDKVKEAFPLPPEIYEIGFFISWATATVPSP